MSHSADDYLARAICARCQYTNQYTDNFCSACGARLALPPKYRPRRSTYKRWAQDFHRAWQTVSGRLAVILCGVFLLLQAGYLVRAYQQQRLPRSSDAFKAYLAQVEQEEQQLIAQANREANPVAVLRRSWHKGGFGSVAVWRITFYNGTAAPVGNIKYRTRYYSETGNLVDRGGVETSSEALIQKVIPPREKRTIEINDGFLHKEAVDAEIEILGWDFIPASNLKRGLKVLTQN